MIRWEGQKIQTNGYDMTNEIRPLPPKEKKALTNFFEVLREVDPSFDLEPVGWIKQELNISLSVASNSEGSLYYFGTTLFMDEETGEFDYELLPPEGVELNEGDSLVGTLFLPESDVSTMVQTFEDFEQELRNE